MAEIKQQGVNQNPAPETNEAVATSAVSVTAPTAPDLSDEAKKLAQKSKRTPGLKLFDVLLYPVLNNISVFIISVGATYLTTRGGMKDASGNLRYGKIGDFFQKRGDWMVKKLEAMGMSRDSADMSKMVFFSFADGTAVAPLVKKLEDHREDIALGIDKALGTVPADMSAYESEPKQSWLSVVGGRLATASIVVPTAVLLDKTYLKQTDPKTKVETFKNINQRFFNDKGVALGKSLEKYGWFKKLATKHDMGEISRVSIFEAFYTSVCTGGLYMLSRFFARGLEKSAQTTYNRTHASAPKGEAQPTVLGDEQAIATTERTADEKPTEKPSPKLQRVAEAERLSQLPAQAVGV